MISCSISRKRIDKSLLIPSKSGVAGEEYLSFTLHENRTGPDQFQNDGIVCQQGSKEQKEQMKRDGKRGPIIGNWRWFNKPAQPTAPKQTYPAAFKKNETNPASDPLPEEDDVPF